jgi:hypothetical protein
MTMTKWDNLALEVRCALVSEGMTKPKWNRLPVVRRQHLLLDVRNAIFAATQAADAAPVWESKDDFASEHVVVAVPGPSGMTQRTVLSLPVAEKLALELATAIAAIRCERARKAVTVGRALRGL